MKHIRFQSPDGEIHVGVLDGDQVKSDSGGSFALGQVRLLAPVVPGKIICVGKNYVEHAKELGGEVPEEPLLFFKPPSAINPPEAPIQLPQAARVDFEGEIAVVIGTRCKDVKQADADSVIWGYTCFNDVSNREAQAWEGNWVRAKGFDTSACLGPVIATPEEMPDPITVTTRVNDQVRQQGHTGQLAFPIPCLIETISRIMTLERGDVIATGTPAGVGPLRSGDVVEVEVSGVGTLKSPVL